MNVVVIMFEPILTFVNWSGGKNLFDSNWETLITLKALRLYSLTKTAGLIIWNSLGFFLKLGQPFFIFSTVFNLALYIDIGEDVFGIFGRFNTFFGDICALMIYTSVFPEICLIHVFPPFLKKIHPSSAIISPFFHLFSRLWPLMCHGGVGNLVKSCSTQLTNTRPSLWSRSIIGWK